MTAPKCNNCGRYCSYVDMDQYIHWGSQADLEPPDPITICAKCSIEEENRIVRDTVKPTRPYIPWVPGRCHRQAVHRLGMVFAGPPMAGWAEAFWPDSISEGWEVHAS